MNMELNKSQKIALYKNQIENRALKILTNKTSTKKTSSFKVNKTQMKSVETYSSYIAKQQYIPDDILQMMNDDISSLTRCGDLWECGGLQFFASQIPPIDTANLGEIKAVNNYMDFGKNLYFKYVSNDGKEHLIYTDNAAIAPPISEYVRNSSYDAKGEHYAGFWRFLMSDDPVFIGLYYTEEEIRGYLKEANIETGFFTIQMGKRTATQFYTKSKNGIIQSKERYDHLYDNITKREGFYDQFKPGDVFIVGGKEYKLSNQYTLDIPYGEDIYDIKYPYPPFGKFSD